MNLKPGMTSSLRTTSWPLLGAMLAGGVLVSGCAATPAAIQDSTVHTAAAIDHNRCGGSEPGSFPLAPDQAEGAEPLFSYVHSGRSDSEARLRGAELRVRVQPGMTSEWLERQIECHAVKTILGQEQARADDPFFLPDGWVDSSVRSEAGSFLVTLRPKNPARAREVLGRAEAFVAHR